MSTHDALDYLLQKDIVKNFIPQIGRKPWQVVYLIDDDEFESLTIYSALLEPEAARKALTRDQFDLHPGEGRPLVSAPVTGDVKGARYHRFGYNEGVRPLVIARRFNGAWHSYVEVCEEFRHFHNLAEDKSRGLLLHFDESGYEVAVARITERRVDIDWSYLMRFLAATQLYLAIYFNSARYSGLDLDAVPPEKRLIEYRGKASRYFLRVQECPDAANEGCVSSSELLGKVLFAPPPFDRCGVWPFEREGKYLSFIIGVNPDGTPREYTCNPDALANYFGANRGAPRFLTPVYFRREVLQKYYAEPERYSVEDGYLRCFDGWWGMRIDNNHPTHVVAFLGYLGQDLPYGEQLHWKQYNVPPPANAGISETNFRRMFRAEFAGPESVDLVFREMYGTLNDLWQKKFGWPLFVQLRPEDQHMLSAIHIPVTSSQRELDEQVLWLAKLLVESLNEAELENTLPQKVKGERGIGKFKRFLENRGFSQTEEVVQFLKDLQAMRSSGAAHRKGEEYQRTVYRLGFAGKSGPDVMRELFGRAVEVLGMLGNLLDDRA